MQILRYYILHLLLLLFSETEILFLKKKHVSLENRS